MAAPLERLEKGDGPPTPNRARVVEFTVRATSLVVKATAAAVVFILVLGLILILNLLLSDAYTQLSWPLVYGAFFAFLSQLSSIGKGEWGLCGRLARPRGGGRGKEKGAGGGKGDAEE